MYEKFTDRARKVMQLANQEAQRFNHEYIGTEHVLLGLIKEESNVAASVLKNLDLDLRKLRMDVEKLMQSGPDTVTTGKLPQTPRVKNVVGYAIEESRKMHHDHVGSEHLLLGLLREQEGVAAQVLMNEGLTLDETRNEVLALLKFGVRGTPTPAARLARHAIEDLPEAVRRIVAEFDADLEQRQFAKEEAISLQKFDKAAALRDEQVELRRRRRQAIHDWAVNYPIETAWLRHNNSAVINLAHEINQLRSWEALPELADALEQAGCNDALLLDHCRQGGAHGQQCWVVDLLLASAEPPDVRSQ